MPRKWSEDVIVGELRAMKARGEPINPYHIEKTRRDLCGGCVLVYGSVGKALIAAGFSPDVFYSKVPYRPRWAVLKAIKERHALGLDMSPSVVNAEASWLYQAGCHRCGSWEDALKQSGIDPDDVYKRKPFCQMSDDSLLKRLRRLHQKGISLTYSSLRKESRVMLKVIVGRFGGLAKALELARLPVPVDTAKDQVMSKEDMLERIREIGGAGMEIEGSLSQRFPRELINASIKYCGNVSKAVKEAGVTHVRLPLAPLDASTRVLKKKYRWTHNRVKECIQFRKEHGYVLDSASVSDEYPGLVRAAILLHKTWDKALVAAGIDPRTVKVGMRRNPYPDIDAVVTAIKRRRLEGKPINPKAVAEDNPILYAAAYRHLKERGWEKAILAAGYAPIKVYAARSCTREDLLAELRERRDSGLPLNVAAMLEEKSAARLYMRILRVFTHYHVAIAAIGLDYEKEVIKVRRWKSPEQVLDAIRELERAGVRLNNNNIFRNFRRIHNAGRYYFTYWSAAVEAAGIRYADHSLVHSTKAWRRRLSAEDKAAIRTNRTVRIKPQEK
jgi:hypothetical protein